MNRKRQRSSGRPSGAEAFGAPANAIGDPTLAELFADAVAQHQAGALAEAERRYKRLLTLFPAHAHSLHNLGLIALQGGNPAAAADLIGRAIAVDDAIADYHYNIALAFRALNRSDDVAAHLERAIALRPDYPFAYLNLGNVRREQGRTREAIACYQRVVALSPNIAAPYFNLANIAAAQGLWSEAARGYEQALAREPNYAEAHAGLGAALLAQRNSVAAVPHLQRALALNPRLFGTYQDLCRAFLALGDLESAIDTSTRALSIAETDDNKALFARCIRFAHFSKDNEQFRTLLWRAMIEGWARPRELADVAISLIKQDATVSACMGRVNAAWPTRLSASELFGAAGLAALARNRLLCALLESDPPTDIETERFLTSVRYAALTSGGAEGAQDDAVLAFYCAVSRQCFVNEYLFATTDAEAVEAGRLRSVLEEALKSGAPVPMLWPVLVAAYYPLYQLANADALLLQPWPQCVKALLTLQIAEPAEERRIAAGIPALTALDDDTSRVVRRQYEENPYPRWVGSGPPGQPPMVFERETQRQDALIAGCGTGLSAIEFARHARAARILAVDLSVASLSYAKRMAQSLGVNNIEFAQADITQLGTIGRTFDFIDASGVLHHLADPWLGWRVLLSLLRPGGVMQVGLYSELARRNVVAARALIAERGYQPSVQDIRRCREDIVTSADPLVRSISRTADFYTTSECRDLLFHPQEHRLTLPQIKAFLAANDLAFTGFVLPPATLHAFAARFPESNALLDLDRWHLFESEAPDTFAGMYLFSVHKPVTPSPTAT